MATISTTKYTIAHLSTRLLSWYQTLLMHYTFAKESDYLCHYLGHFPLTETNSFSKSENQRSL